MSVATESLATNNVAHEQWDLKSLRIEATKQSGKAFKKIEKSLEADPSDPKVAELRKRLLMFNDFDSKLKSIATSDSPEFKSVLSAMLAMGIDSHPPVKPEKVKKIKAPPAEPRKPYYCYTGSDNIEIWVGRGASDNDLLSCDYNYRLNDEWWMHVAGMAGSHVVIKTTANDLLTSYPETVKDAAILCAHNSKAVNSSYAEVTLTRCRNVSKPKGYVPGMVLLQGDINRVPVNLRREQDRLNRLQATKKN